MADHPATAWSTRRFLPRALIWTAVAGVGWKLLLAPNAHFTVFVTKLLHELAGFPAPYLFCDETTFFWHATLFPPVVGLTLASYWLGWPDRLLRAGVGYLVYCVLTAITIAVNESPYLPGNDFGEVLTNTLVNANYCTFGIVIWVLAASPWYCHRAAADGRDGAVSTGVTRVWRCIRYGWITRLVLLTLALAIVPLLYAMTGSPEAMAARWKVATAMREVPFFPHPSIAKVDVSAERQFERDRKTAAALQAIKAAIAEDETDKLSSASLFYLGGQLFISLRHEDPEVAARHRSVGLAYLKRARRTRLH